MKQDHPKKQGHMIRFNEIGDLHIYLILSVLLERLRVLLLGDDTPEDSARKFSEVGGLAWFAVAGALIRDYEGSRLEAKVTQEA